MELHKSKLLQKSITQTLFKESPLLLNRTRNSICQKRLISNICNTKNEKLNLTSPLGNVSIKKEFTRGLKENVIGRKNKEMWKEYRAIDPRVIRPVDGTEFFVADYFINITDVFPKISTEEFKKRIQENFSKIELFNLAYKRINGSLFFIRKPFKLHLEEIEYTEDEEMENYLKAKNNLIVPYEPIFEKDDKDVQALFYFKICQLKKSNQTKITFSINHSVGDGRTAFTVMDHIRKVINGESLEKNDEKLTDFGSMDRFKNLDESFYETPKIWKEIANIPVIPMYKPPYKNIIPYRIFDYKPISKFTHENGISIQAMLMAVMTRASRRYNKLPEETPIWSSTPYDIRSSPYCIDEYKKRKFYNNVGIMHVKLVGQSSIMEDFKHCTAQLKEAIKTNDSIRQVICCSNIVDPKTLKFVPKEGFPIAFTQSIVSCSNIGKVNGTFPILTSSVAPYIHSLSIYSHHTDDKLFVFSVMPSETDKVFVDCIYEEIDKIFNVENIPKN